LIDSAGKEVARGEVGEIIASSPKMMTGYWRSWGEDDLPFIDNKWIKTGDLACRDSNGLFWFMGRRKDIIVLPGGDNISPLEIESHILRIPGVKSCIVAAIPAGDDLYAELAPEEPHAFIVSDIDYSQQQILERLRPLLSNYKLPRKVHFVAEIPRGSSRKISRRLLLDWLVEQEQAG
jgi:acyl-CoA synthetase (AMP-forming)/AMP-acid ligase II